MVSTIELSDARWMLTVPVAPSVGVPSKPMRSNVSTGTPVAARAGRLRARRHRHRRRRSDGHGARVHQTRAGAAARRRRRPHRDPRQRPNRCRRERCRPARPCRRGRPCRPGSPCRPAPPCRRERPCRRRRGIDRRGIRRCQVGVHVGRDVGCRSHVGLGIRGLNIGMGRHVAGGVDRRLAELLEQPAPAPTEATSTSAQAMIRGAIPFEVVEVFNVRFIDAPLGQGSSELSKQKGTAETWIDAYVRVPRRWRLLPIPGVLNLT